MYFIEGAIISITAGFSFRAKESYKKSVIAWTGIIVCILLKIHIHEGLLQFLTPA